MIANCLAIFSLPWISLSYISNENIGENSCQLLIFFTTNNLALLSLVNAIRTNRFFTFSSDVTFLFSLTSTKKYQTYFDFERYHNTNLNQFTSSNESSILNKMLVRFARPVSSKWSSLVTCRKRYSTSTIQHTHSWKANVHFDAPLCFSIHICTSHL